MEKDLKQIKRDVNFIAIIVAIWFGIKVGRIIYQLFI